MKGLGLANGCGGRNLAVLSAPKITKLFPTPVMTYGECLTSVQYKQQRLSRSSEEQRMFSDRASRRLEVPPRQEMEERTFCLYSRPREQFELHLQESVPGFGDHAGL